jgi:hypothetical protein
VSHVGGGRHINIYLSDELIEVARGWPLGAEIKLRRVDGKPDVVICFRQAVEKSYSLRSRSGTQRPHFVVPTEKICNGFDPELLKATESWVEGEVICVRVSGLFS